MLRQTSRHFWMRLRKKPFRETAYQKARTRQFLKRVRGFARESRLRGEKCEVKDSDIQTAYSEIGSDAVTELRTADPKAFASLRKIQGDGSQRLEPKITKSLQLKGPFNEIANLLKEEIAKQRSEE